MKKVIDSKGQELRCGDIVLLEVNIDEPIKRLKYIEAVAKFYEEQLNLRMDAYERERKALEDVEKLDLEKQRFKKELFNVKKQLYCSDQNQKKEHSKFLDALNKYHCELNRRKKAEAKIKELESELEEGGFNDERNFI